MKSHARNLKNARNIMVSIARSTEFKQINLQYLKFYLLVSAKADEIPCAKKGFMSYSAVLLCQLYKENCSWKSKLFSSVSKQKYELPKKTDLDA